MTLTSSPAFAALAQHKTAIAGVHMRELFAKDPERFTKMSREACGIFVDYSKHRATNETLGLLFALAKQADVEGWRDRMFAGDKINGTEHRAVLHTALRHRGTKQIMVDGRDVMPDVRMVLAKMRDFTDRLRSGVWKGHTGERITDVVNIGIGGSDLGPQMAVAALESFVLPGKRFHFVSNIDGHELAAVLDLVRPESTLFLVASKTFTTIETMTNARSARAWFEARGGREIARHFAALTTNVPAAREFGVTTTFGFWDWVGGRYSLWSAIGLPVAIAIGAAGFRALLAGAHEMDRHFATQPLERNLPVRLGLLDVWNRNFHRFASRSIAPYHSALRRLPAYLQQLEMESNGKRVDMEGQPLSQASAPVLWGEPGTNGQHAYFQMLHQGTDVIPVEFIAVKTPDHALAGHHELLLANALAQGQALMQGKPDAGGHRDFPGNRPSTFFLLERLDPASLGALLALHEHRVFVSGSLWGINSFDQWGVELCKVLALDIAPRLASGDASGLDGSSAGLLRRLRQPAA